jgi:hypothetical protein
MPMTTWHTPTSGGKLIIGPWPSLAPRAERRAFFFLTDEEKRAFLDLAVRDLRRYWTDLSPQEQSELAPCLPVPGRGVESLSVYQRAGLLRGGLPVLRHRAGWAA